MLRHGNISLVPPILPQPVPQEIRGFDNFSQLTDGCSFTTSFTRLFLFWSVDKYANTQTERTNASCFLF